MRYRKSILVLLLFSIFCLSCSGGKKEISYTSTNTDSPSETALPADTNGNSDGEPGSDPIPDPDGAPPVTDPNEGDGNITPHRYLIAMIGGPFVTSLRLYTISSAAKEGRPQLRAGRILALEFLEIIPSPLRDKLVVLVAKQEKKTLGQFYLPTDFFYPLAEDLGDITSVTISPDSTKIVFIKKENSLVKSLGLYLPEEQRFDKISFERNTEILSPLFWTDNKLIYLQKTAQRETVVAVEVGSAFGQRRTLLEKGNSEMTFPFLADNGISLGFIEKQNRLSKLKLRNVASGEEVILFEEKDIFEPSLSPDNRYIAFWSQSPEGQQLRIYDLLEKKEKQLTTIFVPFKGDIMYRDHRVHPSWSPRSEEIFYSSLDRSGVGQIYKYHLPTGTIQKLTDGIVFNDFFHPVVLGEE